MGHMFFWLFAASKYSSKHSLWKKCIHLNLLMTSNLTGTSKQKIHSSEASLRRQEMTVKVLSWFDSISEIFKISSSVKPWLPRASIRELFAASCFEISRATLSAVSSSTTSSALAFGCRRWPRRCREPLLELVLFSHSQLYIT